MLDMTRTRPIRAHDTFDTIWPLPRIGSHVPIVRGATCGTHPYADVTYDGEDPALRFVPVFAVRDGVISYADKTTILCAGKKRVCHSISVEHAGGWSTRYGDLEHLFAITVDRYAKRRTQRVRAGDVLGYASHDPIHLSFELWRRDDSGYGPVDPSTYMRAWRVIPWTPWSDTPIANDQCQQPTAA